MMTRQERAKQFAPFDAMKGLQEALRDREERHMRVEKRELSEEAAEAISSVIYRLDAGMKIALEYYRAFHDEKKSGRITKIDHVFKYLILDGEKIHFDDIYKVKIIEY